MNLGRGTTLPQRSLYYLPQPLTHSQEKKPISPEMLQLLQVETIKLLIILIITFKFCYIIEESLGLQDQTSPS